MIEKPKYVIAVDFDGTLAQFGGKFPAIGPEVPGAVRWCKQWAADGAHLFLWTMRTLGEGQGLGEALAWCADRGLAFWGINENPYQTANWTPGGKQWADVYVDDMAAGVPLCRPVGRRPFLDWWGSWPYDVQAAILAAKEKP